MTPGRDCQSSNGVIDTFVALLDGLNSVGPVLSGILNVIGYVAELIHIPLVPVMIGLYVPVNPVRLEMVSVLLDPGVTITGLKTAIAFGGRLAIESVTAFINPKIGRASCRERVCESV